MVRSTKLYIRGKCLFFLEEKHLHVIELPVKLASCLLEYHLNEKKNNLWLIGLGKHSFFQKK